MFTFSAADILSTYTWVYSGNYLSTVYVAVLILYIEQQLMLLSGSSVSMALPSTSPICTIESLRMTVG